MKLENISLTLSNTPIFTDFSAEFPDPGVTFLLGPSGIGKTTLLRLMVGLVQPDGGKLLGFDKNFSIVFQENRLLGAFDIEHNVRFVTDNPLRQDLVDRLGLTPYVHQPIAQLSGGTRRRVALLRALTCDYDCLVLDEIFNGLDDALKIQVAQLLSQETAGKALIIATHHLHMQQYFEHSSQICIDAKPSACLAQP